MKKKFSKMIALLSVVSLVTVMAFALAACSGTATTNTAATKEPTASATTIVASGTTSSSAASASSTAGTSAAVSSTAATTAAVTQKTFTLAELATYDGKNGNPAYVAVDGIVYDVTSLSQWQNGSHQGYQAGVDLTQAFNAAHQGNGVLSQAIIVGVLAV